VMEYPTAVLVLLMSVALAKLPKDGISNSFRSLYYTVGSFQAWIIGLLCLVGGWVALSCTLDWRAFAVVGLMPYATSTVWGLSYVRVGSFISKMSNAHRILGISALFLPMTCLTYQQVYGQHVPLPLYVIACVGLALNCITGLFLIPVHIPSYDVPTLRAFHVGVTLGLAFVAQSFIWRFGHLPQYETFCKALVFYLLYAVLAAVNDSAQHIYTNLTSPFYKTQIDLEYFEPPKTAKEVGLVHKPFPLRYLFWENMWKCPEEGVALCSVTPSSAAVVFTVSMTAFFALQNLVQLHYLACGAEGLQYRTELFPRTVQWSPYVALLAGVANNFGTFAGTVVVKKRVSSFVGAFFNAIGLLIPVIAMLIFISRFGSEENIFHHLSLTQCRA